MLKFPALVLFKQLCKMWWFWYFLVNKGVWRLIAILCFWWEMGMFNFWCWILGSLSRQWPIGQLALPPMAWKVGVVGWRSIGSYNLPLKKKKIVLGISDLCILCLEYIWHICMYVCMYVCAPSQGASAVSESAWTNCKPRILWFDS